MEIKRREESDPRGGDGARSGEPPAQDTGREEHASPECDSAGLPRLDGDPAHIATEGEAAGGARFVALALGREFYARFTGNESFMRAAALSFISILSIIPLLFLATAALGFVIHDPAHAVVSTHRLIARMLPGRAASQAANEVIRQTNLVPAARSLVRGRLWTAALGVFVLLWSATSFFVGVSGPLNAAWEVKETRGFVRLRLLSLAMFAGAGALFVLSVALSSGPELIQRVIFRIGLPRLAPLWLHAAFALAAWIIDIAMFVVIYRFLPNARVTWKAAFVGGATAGVFWETFKRVFAIYLSHYAGFNKLYGALGGIVLLVMWIYYSCLVLIAGATVSEMYHERVEERNAKQTG